MIDVTPRAAARGRPRTSRTGMVCARCQRQANKTRAIWPEGRICGICYHQATRTYGVCPNCGDHRMLPGRVDGFDRPVCRDCSGILEDFTCVRCSGEAEHYRQGFCARCSLRFDLTELLLDDAADPAAMTKLVEIFCSVDRPESILTWKRPQEVRDLLRSLAIGDTPLTHEGLDQHGAANRRVNHLRAILEHHGLLPQSDPHLRLFEAWLDTKLNAVMTSTVRQDVEKFAKWHHLARIRSLVAAGRPAQGPVHASKQEVTQVIQFLTWLDATHQRTARTCTQQDVDEWVVAGPTTRHLIRTFLVWIRNTGLNRKVTLGHRSAKSVRLITQDERLLWLRELITGASESLPYRVAGVLLLLYAQPIVRIAELRTSQIIAAPEGLYLKLGIDPVPVPEPFAAMLRQYIGARANLRTTNGKDSEWLFPGYRPGRHIHPQQVTVRLRELGVDLLASRTTALRALVTEVPPTIVSEMLGYSDQVTHKHAELAGQQWSRYAGGHRN